MAIRNQDNSRFPSYLAPLRLCFKTSLRTKQKFDLHENEAAGRTHFHMKGFAQRLVLKQRQRQLGNSLLLLTDSGIF